MVFRRLAGNCTDRAVGVVERVDLDAVFGEEERVPPLSRSEFENFGDLLPPEHFDRGFGRLAGVDTEHVGLFAEGLFPVPVLRIQWFFYDGSLLRVCDIFFDLLEFFPGDFPFCIALPEDLHG